MRTNRTRPVSVVAIALAVSVGLTSAAAAGGGESALPAERSAGAGSAGTAADGVVELTDAQGARSTTALEALERSASRGGSGQGAPPSSAGPADVAPGDDAVFTGPLSTGEFFVAGLVWDGGENLPAGTEIHLRVREDGVWSDWLAAPDEDAADDGRGRQGTAPFVTGGADAVQVHVSGDPADLPPNLELTLMTAEVVATDISAAATETTALQIAAVEAAVVEATTVAAPTVIDRAGWGADESLMTWNPTYAELRAAVVHHTAGTNAYTSAESAGIVRAIYRYHAVTNGWGDIGYNFLVDKYGQVFEGRRGTFSTVGGLAPAGDGFMPVGAHAQGYNTYSMGISAMGDFTQVDAPQVILDRMADVIAWEFDRAAIDMSAQAFFPANEFHVADSYLPRVIGHRAVSATLCPSDDILGQLDQMTAAVNALLAGELPLSNTAPTASAGSDQTVFTGARVTLAGAAADDEGDPLLYRWMQTGGPAVSLTGAATPTASFKAPSSPATLTFRLTVNDGEFLVTDDITVSVVKKPSRR